jgi:hypothetical protein
MSGYLRVFLLLRSREAWPRYHEGARRDERAWIASLSDRELVRLAAELYAVDKAVRGYRGTDTAALDKLFPPRKDAA